MKSILGLLLALLTLTSPGLAQGNPWTQQTTNLPPGYVVFALDAVDENVVWGIGNAAGASQSFIRTTNGGATWTCSTISAAPAAYCPKGIYAFDANRAWVAMHEHGSITGGGIFHTTDGGVTWGQVPTLFEGSSGTYGCADFIYFFDENYGVCVGNPEFRQEASEMYFEIYTTTDGGVNWSRVPKASLPPPEDAIFGEFTGTENSLWFPTSTLGSGRYIRTTDKGTTWTVHQFPNTQSGWAPTLEFQSDSIGLGQGSQAGVMKTTDGGMTWNLIPNTSWLVLNHLEYVPGTPGMYVGASVLNGHSPSTSWIWGTVVTFDGGLSWVKAGALPGGWADLCFPSPVAGWRIDGSSPDVQKWSIDSGRAITALPGYLPFGSIEVGKSGDTVLVEAVNFGHAPVNVTSVAQPGPSFKIVQQPQLPVTLDWLQSVNVVLTFTPNTGGAIVDSLVFFSTEPSSLRTTVSLNGAGFVSHPAESNVLYAASGSLVSIDSLGGPATRIDTLAGVPMYGLAIHPETHEVYGVSSTANSTTLYRINSANAMTLPVWTISVGDTRGIAFAGDATLYAVTTGGKIYQINPSSGTISVIGVSYGISYVGVAISPKGTLWLSGSDSHGNDNIYVFDSDAGEVTLIGRTGDNTYTPSIAFDSTGVLYGLKGTGTEINTIVSIDPATGASTAQYSTGLQGLTAIAIKGVPVVTGVQEQPDAGVPKVFALHQNYPNPFNPKTGIRYQVPGVSNVRLVVYDVLGREVAVLVDGKKDPGSYEVTYDAVGLSSGVYFYRLQAGAYVDTKKLVLLK